MDLLKNGVTIIAEIGTNHNGDLDTAFRLVETAADCGADIVKFQSFLVDDLLAEDDGHRERLRQLEMPRDWYPALMEKCRQCEVIFLSTATNDTTIGWMEDLGVAGYKLASCNITHQPLLDRLVSIGKPVVVSAGFASMEDLQQLNDRLTNLGFSDFALLHCVSKYPTPADELHLGNIAELRRRFDCPVGFSDHSLGPFMPVAAVALGATIIEKHLTLDGKGIGMDHDVAATPVIFRQMCQAVRETEKALTVCFTPDRDATHAMRRSLHYTRDLAAGHCLEPGDIKIVRPEDGLKPERLEYVIGKKIAGAVTAGQAVREDDLRGS
jgi:N,N'-diacetyllegionaminate synthase